MTRVSKDLRIMACMFCKDPVFHDWLREVAAEAGATAEQPIDEAFAKDFVLAACQVGSRTDLDVNSIAAYRFHQLVRGPFMAWKATQFSGVHT